MKYIIPKGSVQETLLIPLYGRKMAMDLYPDLFSDRDCQELLDKIDFEAPRMVRCSSHPVCFTISKQKTSGDCLSLWQSVSLAAG